MGRPRKRGHLTISHSSGIHGCTPPTDGANGPIERDAKETAIINAARHVFLANGFDGASMDAIALKANVSKRTVYNRFASKEILFVAAIDETCRRILPVDASSLEETMAPRQLLEHMAQTFLRGVLEPEAIALRRIATFEAERKPTLGVAYLEHGPKFLVKTCAPMLARAAAKAGLTIKDPETAIWQLGALISEPLFMSVLLGEVPDDLSAAIDRQIETGLDAFWKIYGELN